MRCLLLDLAYWHVICTDWCRYWLIIGSKECHWSCPRICNKYRCWSCNLDRGPCLLLLLLFMLNESLEEGRLMWEQGITTVVPSMTFEFEPCYYYLQDLNKLRKFMLGPWVGTGLVIIPASMRNLLKQFYLFTLCYIVLCFFSFLVFVFWWQLLECDCSLVSQLNIHVLHEYIHNSCFAGKRRRTPRACSWHSQTESCETWLCCASWGLWLNKYVKCLSLFGLPVNSITCISGAFRVVCSVDYACGT